MGEAAGVAGPWLSVGVVLELAPDGDAVDGGRGGLSGSSPSLRRLTPRACKGRVELSFNPSEVALMRI